jgi:tetratricopeptide (TPR) repeat protein
MKSKFYTLTMVVILILAGCNQQASERSPDEGDSFENTNTLHGKWLKISQMGSFSLNFKNDGTMEGDFGDDGTIELVAAYEIKNDTITFEDKKGPACPGKGSYKIYQSEYWISFDVAEDTCNGRIKSITGFWTKPGYDDFLEKLENQMASGPNPGLYLDRARIFMALGKSEDAKSDLDIYLNADTTNARAYINRAATCFPHNMEDALSDCNKSIILDPTNKNAYFLRGLTLYELGRKEEACEDFSKAIKLGFTVLAKAEKAKCADYW